jgi:hypothetical protein
MMENAKRRYVRYLAEMPFDMEFYVDGIRKENCHATGRQVNTVHPASSGDWWNEYVDSKGELYYGR